MNTTPRSRSRSSFRGALAADLHRLGLRTACEAVGRDIAGLAPAIIRELRAGGHVGLVEAVLVWESGVTGVDLATLSRLAAPTGAL